MNEGVPFLLGRSFYHPPLPPPKKGCSPPHGLLTPPRTSPRTPPPPQCCVLPYGMSPPPQGLFLPPSMQFKPLPKKDSVLRMVGGLWTSPPAPPPPNGFRSRGGGGGGGTLKSWDLSVCSAVCYGAGIRTRVPTVARPPGRQGALLGNEPEAPRGSSRK